MTKITDHQSKETVKLLLIGDSGSGKTGSLASLAAAGYRLRIIDVDNGLDVLKSYLTNPKSLYVQQNPRCAENVEFETITDAMRNINGRIVPKSATVWQRTLKLLQDWNTSSAIFGPLTTWTPQDVLVIDSLSMLSTAALNFHLSMQGQLGGVRTSNEGRRDIGEAQRLLRGLLELLYDEHVKCNIILTSHITFVSESGHGPQAAAEAGEIPAGYPSAIGRALSPHIPRYFNTVLFCKTEGSKHKIYTKSQGVVNVKNTAPMSVAPSYPLETGLADYFKAIKEQAQTQGA